MSFGKGLSYPDSEDRIFNRVITDISVVLKETTLTISDSIETGSPVETKIVRVVSLKTTEIIEITRLKEKNTTGLHGSNTLNNDKEAEGAEQDQNARMYGLILLYTLLKINPWSRTAE